MTDPTAAHRVKRYRAAQKADRGIRRVEVQVPSEAVDNIKRLSRRLVAASRKAGEASRQVEFVLATVNAPRPHPIAANTLVHCLLTSEPEARWLPHIEAFFDEVSPEAIHDIVLAGIVSFEDLYRAARTWRVTNASNIAWIKEMADLRLAEPVA